MFKHNQNMVELRLRSKISEEELKEKVGKILTDNDYNVLITREARVLKPDGTPLLVYLPGAVKEAISEAYPTLTKIRMPTDNRKYAAGTEMVQVGKTRRRTKPVLSGLIGYMDKSKAFQYCRLTAFTNKKVKHWQKLQPLFQDISKHFAKMVPDRYANQMKKVAETKPDWIIENTPFTTITVNNTYPTGVHTDKGDLDEGFSCLAVARRGNYKGGRLTFPEYRVAVDMEDGDMILMDAHEWHGNTEIVCQCGNVLDYGPCQECKAERISVVCYYRTNMDQCGTLEDEENKKRAEGLKGRQMTDAPRRQHNG